MIEIKDRWTGKVLHTHAGDSLVDANLARANLAGANLEGANLAGANLAGAYLADANLAGANLARAYLADAYLAGANLARANLEGANLEGAYLAGAYLARANLARAKISADHTLIESRPLMHIGPIGSRFDVLCAYRTNKGLMLRVGCFFGTADEFASAVSKTHKDSTHALDYMAALAFVRDWFARSE